MEMTVGYLIDADDMRKLREIERKLHGGTDAQRDLGHQIWLVLNRALPVEDGAWWVPNTKA